MEHDFEELKSEMEAKAVESFELSAFFLHNLNNFAHRYFNSSGEAQEVKTGFFEVKGQGARFRVRP